MSKAITYYCDICNPNCNRQARGLLWNIGPGTLREFNWLSVRSNFKTYHICLHCREEGKGRKDVLEGK